MNKCKYCGKTWGGHYGSNCYPKNSPTEFVPLGSTLTDICERCGVAFESHSRRMFCANGYGEFKAPLPTTINLLPEELFDI